MSVWKEAGVLKLELTTREFRRLLDMVYIGNWILNSTRGDGGIHEAIMDYEDTVFYEILAEELARRDMGYAEVSPSNYDELVSRMDDYIAEFEAHGTDNILIDSDS